MTFFCFYVFLWSRNCYVCFIKKHKKHYERIDTRETSANITFPFLDLLLYDRWLGGQLKYKRSRVRNLSIIPVFSWNLPQNKRNNNPPTRTYVLNLINVLSHSKTYVLKTPIFCGYPHKYICAYTLSPDRKLGRYGRPVLGFLTFHLDFCNYYL